jgi:hypothetical protein
MDDKKWKSLPNLKIDAIANKKGEKKTLELPKHTYMKRDGLDTGFLMITPWKFSGWGGSEDDDYWALGAQFLQNYYTIYDFEKLRVGVVESKTAHGI